MLRLTQEMARAAKEYDEARKTLADHHSDMEGEEATLLKGMERLAPVVDAYLADPQTPSPSVARQLLRYQNMADQLYKVRQAKRLAYPATLPPGEARLGGAIGDPACNLPPAEKF